MTGVFTPVWKHAREVILWYSGILFSQRVLPGLLIILAATGSADWGGGSLVCAHLMLVWGRVFEIPDGDIKIGGYCANAILFGLYLGNTISSLSFLVVAGFSGSFLLFVLTRSLNHILWEKYHLPVCSYPFVLTVFLFSFLCQSEGNVFGTVFLKPWSFSGGRIDGFFHNPFRLDLSDRLAYEVLGFVYSVGSVFFQKAFFPSLLATIGLVLTSRFMTYLAILGYGASRILMAVFPFFCGGHELAYGFNAVLIAIAIGGGFFVPGTKATLLMVSSQFIGFLLGLFCIATTRLTGGDWTALPFNLVVSGILLSMQGRSPHAKPMRPGMAFETPEEAMAYYRRYEERIFLRSVAFPVFGRWKIVQGFHGNETHKEAWRYGVDLAAVDEAGTRFRSTGIHLDDYFAFNAPVLSPVDGVISSVWGEVDDNALGNMNLGVPWGNHVIIYSAGVYVGLYHLKKASILVAPGQTVTVGTPLGRVGNSGRSALPHLHFQLQWLPAVGAENTPFLFQDLLVEDGSASVFRPFFKPEESLIVSPVPPNDVCRMLLFPRNGESWHLEIEESGKKRSVTWNFAYSLYGNVVLSSDDGEEIEYHVGAKCVEVTRFSTRGLSPLNLFAVSLSDMPFSLKRDLQWKTVLFGRNAYPFLGPARKLLSWLVGDLFSAMCAKTVFEESRDLEENPATTFSLVSVFNPPPTPGPVGMQVFFRFGPQGFESLMVKNVQETRLMMRKIAST